MNEIVKMTKFVNHVCDDNCETCGIKCNYYEIAKQFYDAGYRRQDIDFITNEEVQTDDIARIIRTSYSLSPCTSDAAKAIYNSGYRKLSNNIVVMTKEDLKLYKLSIIEGLIEKLKNIIHERDYLQGYAEIGLIEEIDELSKDYLK